MSQRRKRKQAHIYGISLCPDTGRQFLVEIGKDNNICELTPSIVKTIRRAKWLKEAKP